MSHFSLRILIASRSSTSSPRAAISSHSENEVFWRADGTSFAAEYFSHPKIKDGEIVGAVITFMDISERKQREAEIRYLSDYDPLTGLQNRRHLISSRRYADKATRSHGSTGMSLSSRCPGHPRKMPRTY